MEHGIFFESGNSLAQSRIDQNDEIAATSSIKTVTFKAPDYVIEAIDAFASYAETTRSAVIADILKQYFCQAFVEFTEGYLENFNSDTSMEQRVLYEAMALTENLSLNSAEFIVKSVTTTLEG
jgi:hypothetical protein